MDLSEGLFITFVIMEIRGKIMIHKLFIGKVDKAALQGFKLSKMS